jgi:ligand-binding sensor domain-containing protein
LSRRNLVHCGAAQGLTHDFTRSVAESADGTIWVGTIGGGLYTGGLEGFRPFAPEPLVAFYAAVDSVLAAADGSLWWGGPRALLHWDKGKLVGGYTNESWVNSASVTALSDDRAGGVWIGTSAGRLVHFQEGQFSEFPHRIARGAITALAQQADGFWTP